MVPSMIFPAITHPCYMAAPCGIKTTLVKRVTWTYTNKFEPSDRIDCGPN